MRRAKISVLVALILFVLPALAPAYTIVRTNGTKLEVQGPPEIKGGIATYTLAGGKKGSMPESEIDKKATTVANAGSSAPAKSPGSVAPGGKSKSSFTNEDLAKAEGRSEATGDVKTGTAPAGGAKAAAATTESEEEWAKRHDEEMARLKAEREGGGKAAEKAGTPPPGSIREGSDDGERAAEAERAAADARRGTSGGEAAAGGEGAAGAAPAAEKTDAEKRAELEKKVADLQKKLADLDQYVRGGGGNAATVNERLRVADELNKAQAELAGEEEE